MGRIRIEGRKEEDALSAHGKEGGRKNMAGSLETHVCGYVYAADRKKKALGPKGTSANFQYQGVIADEGLDDFWSKDEAAKR